MKKVTLKVDNCSVAQWSTLLLELNLMVKAWKKFGPRIELQASSRSWPMAKATSHKLQAASATTQ